MHLNMLRLGKYLMFRGSFLIMIFTEGGIYRVILKFSRKKGGDLILSILFHLLIVKLIILCPINFFEISFKNILCEA